MTVKLLLFCTAEGMMKVIRLLANNPRTLTLEDAKEIYRRAL